MPLVPLVAPSAPPPSEPRSLPPEHELVRALLAGDRRVAGALYDHLRPAIHHALRRVLHARHRDFEDLVQTTFERVLRGLVEGRFEGRSSLTTWASAIASHVALDALRASFRDERRFEDAEGSELPSAGRPENRLEALAELRRIQGVLSRMKPDLAETLLLSDVLGHSLEEIARLRGAGVAATQSRLHRARLELKRRAKTRGDSP